MLAKHRVSSWVIDSLCDGAGEQNATVACFYFSFVARKEQSPRHAGRFAGTVGLRTGGDSGGDITSIRRTKMYWSAGTTTSDIVKMLQITASRKHTFICINAVDECEAGYRVKLLDSLNRILQKSPSTRIFMAGRPHLQSEIGRRLSGRVTSLSISLKKIDVVRYLHARLTEDTIPDAMGS